MKGKRLFWWIRFCIGIVCLSANLSAYGTQTEIWTVGTFDEFAQGEFDQISLTETGELLLAPRYEQVLGVKDQTVTVWALARDSQGNVYAGTSDEGRVFKITPEGEISMFFDSPEVAILSLAVDAADNVYAGSAPDGLIYKLTPDGSQTVWYSTAEHYVWSLVFDASGVLYAGTGDNGKIFKILPDGSNSVFYDSPQSHVMALVHDIGGWLYAGTEGKGITYKIGLDGSVFALHDVRDDEVRALTLDSHGNLYVAAISSEFFPQPQNKGQGEQAEAQPTDKSANRSTIYCIAPDGTVTTVVEFPEMLIYSMVADQNDHLLVGSDTKGRLYRVLPADRTFHQMITLENEKISALLPNASGQLYVGTSDKGAVVRVETQLTDQGNYVSTVYDAKSTVTWGKIFWQGSTNQVTLQTRTGNTAIPDDTWSPWSEELLNKDGAPVPNPAARFLQWKAVFTANSDLQETPRLDKVSVAFLPHNLAPEVQEIAIFYPDRNDSEQPMNGNSGSTSSSRSNGNGRKPQSEITPPKQIPPGYLAIGWQARDPNQESLEYTVSLRGEEETRWNVLEEDLKNPGYFLDTSTLMDGAYYVKITASDLPANPPDRALSGEKVSERFVIDNTAPEILMALNQRQDATGILITVLAQDATSRLEYAEYALNGDEWIPIFPDDAVTDSRDEKYSIPLTALDQEEHLVVFRAVDSHQNVGVAKFVFSPQDLGAPEPQPESPPSP